MEKGKRYTGQLMRDVMTYWHWYLASILATAAYLVIELYVRNATGQLTDAIIGGSNRFWFLWEAMVAAHFLAAPFHGLSTYTKARMAHNVLRDLRRRMGSKAFTVSVPAMQRQRTGDILSRLGSEMDEVEDFVYYGLSFVTTLIVQGIGSLVLLFSLDTVCTLILLAGMAVSVICGFRVSKTVETSQQNRQCALGKGYHVAKESFIEIQTVKSYGAESYFIGKYGKTADSGAVQAARSAKTEIISRFVSETVAFLPLVAALLYGVVMAARGEMTVGTLVSLSMVGTNFSMMIQGAPESILYLRKAAASCNRIYAFLYEEDEPQGTVTEKREETALRVQNLRYAYKEDRQILAGVDFVAEQNRLTALVGGSGAGKTTIIRLICGFLLPQEGQVRVYGADTREWNREALRRNISLVSQVPYLFQGTVRAYLQLVQPQAGEEALLEACSLAGFPVGRLEKGLDTQIEERGKNFSGGERQRLAIAQALLKPASLIIFDEPTSALDELLEQEINTLLQELRKKRAVLVISHRLKMVENADRIYVLQNGGVAQAGTHDELMAREGGLYRDMYQAQMVDYI